MPDVKRKEKDFVFLVHTKKPTRDVGGTYKALINSHVAKLSHEKRRQKGQLADHQGSTARDRSLQLAQEAFSDGVVQSLVASALRHGNSDPFTATVIPVTALVHECLVFTRDCYLPSLHGKEIDLAHTTLYMDAFWQDAVDGLQDECKGHAYLARSAAILTTIGFNPEMEKLAIFFRTQAINTLRQKLAKLDPDKARLTMYWAVYSLFSAEIAAHNWPAAQVHGRYLCQILQPPKGNALRIESRFRQAVMYQDIQRAALSLTRPSFDLHRWVTDFLPVSWLEETGIDATLPILHVDPSCPSNILRSIIRDVKEWLAVLGLLLAQPSYLNGVTISNGSTRGLILEAELIDLYLDTMDIIESGANLMGDNFLIAYHTAAGALAGLTWRRRVGNHENMGIGSKLSLTGTNVYNAGPIIRDKMESLLRRSDEAFGRCRRNKGLKDPSWRIRLWCFYVGAIVEQSLPGMNPSKTYHNLGFVALAKQCDLHTWDAVQSVLEGFLYFEGIGPGAQVWFERLAKNMPVTSLPPVDKSKELVEHRTSYIQSFSAMSDSIRSSNSAPK
jgi:hypothetical protein